MSTAAEADLRVETISSQDIASAAEVLRNGGVVAFPTETVYGLGANATDAKAVARIYQIKRRPAENPLIVHVASTDAAARLGAFDERAQELAAHFWPGPLTLVVNRLEAAGLADSVTASLPTVALRTPSHPVALGLLQVAGIPLAAPSANRSGQVSPTSADHVADDLDGESDLILNGGPCKLGIESTVVALKPGRAVLLRPGAVPATAIEAVLGIPLAIPSGGQLQAPGMMESHYAPRAQLRLKADTLQPGEALLAFGPNPPQGAVAFANLSPSGDINEAAKRLYAALRKLDAHGVKTIAVAPIPDSGIGAAINDRLRRAAAPRA